MTSETTSLLAELKLGNEKIVEGNEKIVTMLKEAQSEERGMSSANADFATTLLRGLGYTVAEERVVRAPFSRVFCANGDTRLQ